MSKTKMNFAGGLGSSCVGVAVPVALGVGSGAG